MPIKEEPVRIEFQYEKEDTNDSDSVFNVEYFSEKEDGKDAKYVKLTPHGKDASAVFELDFLVEVVDFLRKKGVVDEKIPAGPTPREGLPLPQIKQSGSSDMISPSNSIPVSSFVQNGEGESQLLNPPTVRVSGGNGPKVISASANDAEAISVINRPVIKTRIGETEDPLRALEESKRQRGESKKTFRRTEDAEVEISEV